MRQLTPELAERAHLVSGYSSYSQIPEANVAAWKAPFGPKQSAKLNVVDTAVPGPHGPVPIRIYTPISTAENRHRPAMIWMHGGAFCWGDLDMPEADEVARGVAARANAVVISVDYRLCEFTGWGVDFADRTGEDTVRFPVPQDDCQAVYQAVLADPDRFGVDPKRVAVGGASAGASLAATLTIRQARVGHPVWQTFLLYPLLHRRMPEPSPELAEAIAAAPPALQFDDEMMQTIFQITAGSVPEAELADYYPGGSDNVQFFGPTYLENAEFDAFRASGHAFADELRAAGVPVDEVTRPGVPHGHLDLVGFGPAQATINDIADRLA